VSRTADNLNAPAQAEWRENAQGVLPMELSVGNQVRLAHRALQRYLQAKVGPYGVTLGMWYFLRALWEEDGLTQAELSRRIGTMEPTTVSAIQAMERNGLVDRVRHETDRRKVNIHLTEKGRRLQARLMPLAVDVIGTALEGFSREETELLTRLLRQIQANIAARTREDSLYDGDAESLLDI